MNNMLKSNISLKETIAFFNDLLKVDPYAITKLIDKRVHCNKALADHPTVQVQVYADEEFRVGVLGVLNGLFGISETGYGQISAIIDNDGFIKEFIKTEDKHLFKEIKYSETQVCPRRKENMNYPEGVEKPDKWEFFIKGDDHYRTCSYCGSIHPEDFEKAIDRVVAGEKGCLFDTTTKGYKFYVSTIWNHYKYYTMHTPKDTEYIERMNPKIKAAIDISKPIYAEMSKELTKKAEMKREGNSNNEESKSKAD